MSKMMKALLHFSSSVVNGRSYRRWNFRISLYFTHLNSDSLYYRLQYCNKQRVSVIPALDKWVLEGRPVDYKEFIQMSKLFRKYGSLKPALEIAEWMSQMEQFDVTAGHAAIQLDLISKVHGMEQAENYFNSLEPRLLVLPVYGTLLNCYAHEKSLEKAEATMKAIREFGSSSRDCEYYNTMLSLYCKLCKHKKMEELLQKMDEKGIDYNSFTYNTILHACGIASDIEGMEKFLKRMELDPMVTMNYFVYVSAANGYTRAGASEKAVAMLKFAECLIKGVQRKNAYRVLITLYATLNKKEDVHRLWDALDNSEKLYNPNCISMIDSLVKLDDLVCAEKILEEWEEKTKYFAISIPNKVIYAYCMKGRVKEAEKIVNRLVHNGNKLTSSTWSVMAIGYQKNGQMEKAVEMSKKSLVSDSRGWRPNLVTIAACLEHLKNEGNTDEIQEILMLMEKHGKLETGFKERLERYACAPSQA